MNLPYAKWLHLPIKDLEKPRDLFNVDGTLNKSGKLYCYTDLQVRTGTQTITLRFFLTDIGEHRAILGYPWFAAVQPKIDWKRGWLDHTQLPIIFKAPNAAKATFVPRTRNIPQNRQQHQDQYFIGRVTIHAAEAIPTDTTSIPKEYQRHGKVFSEE